FKIMEIISALSLIPKRVGVTINGPGAKSLDSDPSNNTERGAIVSVVMAVKNEEQFIREAVCSVTSQASVDVELIVVDDNSTDRTWDILAGLADADSRIRLAKNMLSGKNSAFNLGVSLATGDY